MVSSRLLVLSTTPLPCPCPLLTLTMPPPHRSSSDKKETKCKRILSFSVISDSLYVSTSRNPHGALASMLDYNPLVPSLTSMLNSPSLPHKNLSMRSCHNQICISPFSHNNLTLRFPPAIIHFCPAMDTGETTPHQMGNMPVTYMNWPAPAVSDYYPAMTPCCMGGMPAAHIHRPILLSNRYLAMDGGRMTPCRMGNTAPVAHIHRAASVVSNPCLATGTHKRLMGNTQVARIHGPVSWTSNRRAGLSGQIVTQPPQITLVS